ncbi:hypothetical protein QWA_03110 [Alcaligenes faecalis subsp. faecalis NCIB 8687]|uniref:lysozyme inhibitor LprI family protein n=1 Tax=Alcaligenes TaxID=507 RepID=UPI000269E30B|nr:MULTISPECIES: lysozyme inhibitor LprI family protein [Alcaligenes]EJC65814.1 hypothetical protein QWA_03110 [Alcaligenes faecalis subsp. faecalis NCIB 8687]ULH08559.1 lysozyme inhibitor LprI family protein [Alcaligenes faecalis]UTM01703.1 lysozyme inhibitor LprI family protein [Alcaligenes sp. NLF5-7]
MRRGLKLTTPNLLKAVGLLALSAWSTGAHAASFDCSKASNYIEHQVCADPNLSALDEQLAKVYKEALARQPDSPSVKRAQRAWLREVRAKCTSSQCLSQAYTARIQDLSGAAPVIAAAPVNGQAAVPPPQNLPTTYRLAPLAQLDALTLIMACKAQGFPFIEMRPEYARRKTSGALEVKEVTFPVGCGVETPLGDIDGAGVVSVIGKSTFYGFIYTKQGRAALFSQLEDL